MKLEKLLSLPLAAALAASSLSLTASASPSNTSADFLRNMGVGWNLGNSLDANENGTAYVTGLASETCWGNPKTTKAMILAVKEAGFGSVRIPVSWANHVDGSYKIDGSWLARVKQVVDLAYDEGMYVILNDHHDNLRSWEKYSGKAGYYPDSSYRSESEKYLTAVWTQIADEFSDYGERLVFETMNEPRLRETGNEWWFSPDSPPSDCADSMETINYLNQRIVDTIRASGGNNRTRYIMCPGYAAAHFFCLSDAYKLPSDPVSSNSGRIAVSVHAYRPYELCLAGNVDYFDSAGRQELEQLFSDLNGKFMSKGIPVVIGETGCSDKNNISARKEWCSTYFALGRKYGIPCFLWDNNAGADGSDGERHGHLDRSSLTWRSPELIKTIMNASGVTAKKDISSAEITLAKDNYTYDGKAKKPAVTVRYGTVQLSQGKDFSVSYSDNVNVGTARVTVTGLGSCTGTRTVSFTISPAAVAGDVNSDGVIDIFDLALLRQYVSHWNVTVNKDAADVTADGTVDIYDIARLQQYLCRWNVKLG